MNEAVPAPDPHEPSNAPLVARRWALLLGVVGCVLIGSTLATQLTPSQSWTAAFVFLMAWFWITEPIPLWATALIPLGAFPLTGAAPLLELAAQYFDPVNFLFLGGMWIARAMEEWSLHRRLALGVVSKIGTRPRGIVFGFMVATAGVSMFISNTAAAVMMAPLGVAVIERLKALGNRNLDLRSFATALMLGIGYSASIGGVGTKIGTGTNLVFVKEAERALGLEVSFGAWLLIGLPIVVLVLPTVWWYLVAVVAALSRSAIPGATAAIEAARSELPAMHRGEKVALTAFVGAGLLWVFRADIDFGAWVLRGWGSRVPFGWSDVFGRNVNTLPEPVAALFGPRGAEAVVALAMALPLLFIPAERGRRVLPLRAAAGISWGLLVLLGGGFAMAHAITKSGLSGVLAGLLGGSWQLPALGVVLLVCLAATALSEVASNTATASILLPILAAMAPTLGADPKTLMFSATLAASFGFMLPAGTPPNAVVFASGYVPVTTMARAGFAIDVVGSLLVGLLCYWLVPWALGG